MKLKVGVDKLNKEYVLFIQNQLTIVFDFDFKTIKLITSTGTFVEELEDIYKTAMNLNERISLQFPLKNSRKLYIGSGSFAMDYRVSNYTNWIDMNHNHIRNLADFLMVNVPFNINNRITVGDLNKITDIKCFKDRFVIVRKRHTDNKETTDVISNISIELDKWLYYFDLRDQFQAKKLKDESINI